jgi:hypothetical protein
MSPGVMREATAMSQSLEFYRGTGKDSEGRTPHELWNFSHDTMEYVHDFT